MTSKAQHTPAPWTIGLDSNIRGMNKPFDGRTITIIAHGVENKGNAHLIAAAPDLLEALEDVTRILKAVTYTAGLGKGQQERLQKALAAIAKARGES